MSAILANVVAMISKVIVIDKDVLWSGKEIKMWWTEKLSWSMFVEVLVVKREKRTMVGSCEWEEGDNKKDVARFSFSLFCIFSLFFFISLLVYVFLKLTPLRFFLFFFYLHLGFFMFIYIVITQFLTLLFYYYYYYYYYFIYWKMIIKKNEWWWWKTNKNKIN
jgi:hypothetical protein